MAAPDPVVRFLDYSGSDGVEMNVLEEDSQIGVMFAEQSGISRLKEVALS